MEKFEKHMKDKLGQRELTPSPLAWQRIAEQLGEEKRPKRNYSWMGWAASIAVVAILSFWFFNRNAGPDSNQHPTIVEIERTEKTKMPIKSETLEQERFQLTEENVRRKEKVSLATKSSPTKKINLANHYENRAMAQTEQAPLEMADTLQMVADERIQHELESVLFAVNAMEQNTEAVTDTEIDSLLREAQKVLFKERLLKNVDQIDALALLNEVEVELFDESRDKLFNKLKERFSKLRTAVADRNN